MQGAEAERRQGGADRANGVKAQSPVRGEKYGGPGWKPGLGAEGKCPRPVCGVLNNLKHKAMCTRCRGDPEKQAVKPDVRGALPGGDGRASCLAVYQTPAPGNLKVHLLQHWPYRRHVLRYSLSVRCRTGPQWAWGGECPNVTAAAEGFARIQVLQAETGRAVNTGCRHPDSGAARQRGQPGSRISRLWECRAAGLGQPDSRTISLREVRLRDCRAWDTPTAGPENRKVGQCRSSADRRAGLGMERSPCGSGGYYRQTDQSEKHCASRARVRQGRAPAGQCGWRQAAPRLASVFHSVAGPVFRAVPAPIPRATFCP